MTARLLHVGVSEVSAKRYLSKKEAAAADGDKDRGKFEVRKWAEGRAMVLLTVRLHGDEHFAQVTIAALYEFDEGDSFPVGDEEHRRFYTEHVAELTPFLRQALYTASSQVWPIKPIMMDAIVQNPAELIKSKG